MNRIELKPGIFIEGFDTFEHSIYVNEGKEFASSRNSPYNLLYQGKTSDISEELAEECAETLPDEICVVEFDEYLVYENHSDVFVDYSENNKWVCDNSGIWYYGIRTAKESIKSACSNEFCIIYKTN